MDVLFSCLKVLHIKLLDFTFAAATKKLVADVYEEYDSIADANELTIPYITAIYGKSKHHFLRIIGCLWALEIAFRVLKLIEVIPSDKDAFISEILTKYATLEDPTVVTIEVVRVAIMVNSYFIEHKLIMSEIEREESGEYKFVKTAAKNCVAKSSAPTSLEQRILMTAGQIVFLTPLSASHLAKKDTFKASCNKLAQKGLGEYGKFPADENSSRTADGFKKIELPAKNSEEELRMTNALLDYEVSLDVYARALIEPNIIPKTPTSKSTSSKMTSNKSNSGIKRSANLVSLDNIIKTAKEKTAKEESTKEESTSENEDN